VRRSGARIARKGRDERGFTLVELLVAMAVALLVGGAGLTFMVITFDQQNAISSRVAASRQAEQGLQQLVRDLREAMPSPNTVAVSTSASSKTTSIAFSIPTPGSSSTAEQVTWTCPSTAASAANIGTCSRAVTSAGSTTTKSAILGVQSMALSLSATGSPAVTTATNPSFLDVTLSVQVTSHADSQVTPDKILRGPNTTAPTTSAVVVQTGIDLRNFS
jgi:prepilin-type N-terminal cleavage/methylation domain-containing protein